MAQPSLKGDIFRCHYTCSTVENRDIALQNLSQLYMKNEYPRRLLEKTIREILNKNFQSNGNHQNIPPCPEFTSEITKKNWGQT